jgi:tetratricopeptide (TPR) repeat protein
MLKDGSDLEKGNVEQNLLELKKDIYLELRDGKFSNAEDIAFNALADQITDSDLEEVMRVTRFWENRADALIFSEDRNSGELLFEEWDRFVEFCLENKVENKKIIGSVKSFIFRTIIDMLIEYFRINPCRDRNNLVMLGQAFYEVGENQKAIQTLEYALSFPGDDNDIRIYLLLGDMYSESGNDELAMVMFGEAFYLLPQMINIDGIGYTPIKKLKNKIIEDGFSGNEIAEWIPVYGYLYKGLTVRRNLEYNDYLQLQQRIKEYEKSLKIDKKVIGIITPRLINYYLWVFDYYLFQMKAQKGAKKVADRIIALFDELTDRETLMNRLKERARTIFQSLLEENNSWDARGDENIG